MPEPLLPRFYAAQQRLEDDRKLARIILETGEALPTRSAAGATAAGDPRRLRGLPAIARGVSGTTPSTDPLAELLRRERRGEL